jgi:beta-glucosidase
MQNNRLILSFAFVPVILLFISCNSNIEVKRQSNEFKPPVSYESAAQWADSIVALMTPEEKINFLGGDRIFFTNAVPRLNIPAVMMADATMGVHLRKEFDYQGRKYVYDTVLPKSTAFPASILLASTWNRELAWNYARSIGEECRAAGIPILLGPGMNIYRISQCGRNFEYYGEDPYLAGRMIENYVTGLEGTGTIATLKHFVANNTDYFRRKSNSVIDERTLHEIYTPAFKAGIDAGAMAVMTSYNLLNGEYCGQSANVINGLLRNQLGFKWMVVTDWWSVYEGEKVIKSGQDLEMPYRIATKDAAALVQEGKVKIEEINRMVTSVLRTLYAMDAFNRKQEKKYLEKFEEHEQVALQTAREGIVLLRNENNILPIESPQKEILLTGEYLDTIAEGGGAATVEGYNRVTISQALKKELGAALKINKKPSDAEIRSATIVILSIGTYDSEGWDRPFDLPAAKEELILKTAALNPNIVVIVNTGSGINMSRWNTKVKAILYAWYGGQTGATATAEIISGKTNPSGKLPVTIEKDFKDSPGYGYMQEGAKFYTGWNDSTERKTPIYDVVYKEGIFVGYRWYEKNNIEPLYPFGFGLSYTSFKYNNLKLLKSIFQPADEIEISFIVTNTGDREGAETAQLYIQDIKCSVPRPVKELKGFEKLVLKPGETKQINISLKYKDFAFWDPAQKNWVTEPGKFKILIGSSSANILLSAEIGLQ